MSPEEDKILNDYNIESPIIIKNLQSGHIILENNIFESNIGMYGGSVYIHNTDQ